MFDKHNIFSFLFFQVFGFVLPAGITLFVSRQQNRNNLDVCYLNYLCSLDVFGFNAFNSMTSSSSIAVIGILNLIIVFRKKIFRYQVPRFPTSHGVQKRQAPKVVFLLGLCAVGIWSIVTVNCPRSYTYHLSKYFYPNCQNNVFRMCSYTKSSFHIQFYNSLPSQCAADIVRNRYLTFEIC